MMCFHRFQIRELVVRGAQRLRGKLKYKGSQIHIFEDYSPEIVEQRSAYQDVMKELYNLGLRPTMYYPAKRFITTGEGLRQRLISPEAVRDFISSQRRRSSGPTED